MKIILSSILLASTITSYAGYIIPDTRKSEFSAGNDAVSAASFRKINNVLLTTSNTDTSVDEDGEDTDTNMVGTAAILRANKKNITIESYLIQNKYDEEQGFGKKLTAYRLMGAVLLNEKISIGGGVFISDGEEGLLDFTTTQVNGVLKIQDNMYIGAGVSQLAFAHDYGLDDKKTFHGGFGMITDKLDVEGVVLIANGDDSDSRYSSDDKQFVGQGVFRLNEKIELIGKFTATLETADYSNLGVDTEEKTSELAFGAEYEINSKLFALGTIQLISSEFTDNDNSSNDFETSSTELGFTGRYLHNEFEFQGHLSKLTGTKSADDSDDDTETDESTFSLTVGYKF